ncbi:hypothetical protein [Actinomadura alba]|uniref:DivIVA domain-containing protein n=1 Tax=Actinomadura alba TaxID=406431 RepID=A0ABR7LR97_9ACTN|nr:hypothetical protein [Actinomadura alba]MBC6467005.1 hypothetical protein [Actinomadura alba]
MVLAIALAGMAVLGAVIILAMGMGGELAETHPDHPPLALPGNDRLTGPDAALLRLPMGVWGYHANITNEALDRLAIAVTQRDTRIAVLEQQLAELRRRLGDEREEPIRWNLTREPQSSSSATAELPAWSPPEIRPAGTDHESYGTYSPYDQQLDQPVTPELDPPVTSKDDTAADEPGRDR